jgi:hypothetical protein
MTPLTKKVLQWLALLLGAAVVINLAARIVVSLIPVLAVLIMYVLIFGLLVGYFSTSKK